MAQPVPTFRASVADTAAATTYTVTPTWTPAADSLLVVFIFNSHATAAVTPSTVTGHGLSYAELVNYGSTQANTSIWYAWAGSSPTSAAEAATWGSNRTGCAMIAFEVTGAATTVGAAFPQNATTTGTSAGATATDLLAAQIGTDSIAMASWGHNAAELSTGGGGNWSEPAGADVNYSTPDRGFQVQASSVFDRSPSAGWATSAPWRVVAVEISAPASAGAVFNPLSGRGGAAAHPLAIH